MVGCEVKFLFLKSSGPITFPTSMSSLSFPLEIALVLQWDMASLTLKIRWSMKNTKAGRMNHFLAGSVYRELTISWKLLLCLTILWNVRVNNVKWFMSHTRMIKTWVFKVLPLCECYWALLLEHLKKQLYSIKMLH